MLSDSKLSHLNCYFTLQDTKAVLISSLINCEHYIILKFTFLKEIFWGYFLEVKCCDSLKFMLYFLLLFFFFWLLLFLLRVEKYRVIKGPHLSFTYCIYMHDRVANEKSIPSDCHSKAGWHILRQTWQEVGWIFNKLYFI